jgi:hypothetical protein
MKILIQTREEISNNKNQYWCSDATKIKSITKEARDYSEVNGQKLIYANAVVINSHVTKFIFNSYIKLKKVNFPFKAFTKKEDAIEWLKQIKSENEAKGIF